MNVLWNAWCHVFAGDVFFCYFTLLYFNVMCFYVCHCLHGGDVLLFMNVVYMLFVNFVWEWIMNMETLASDLLATFAFNNPNITSFTTQVSCISII